MKKDNRNHIRFSLILPALLCILIVLGVLFFTYIRFFGRSIQEENRSRLSEVSGYIVNYMKSMLSEQQVELTILASVVSDMDGRQEQLLYLGEMAEELGFEYIGLAGSDGVLEASTLPKPEDVSGEAFFRASMEGEPYISDIMRQIFYDKAVGGIIMSVPVPGEERQVLAAMVSTAKLGEDVQVESFGKRGYTYIINADGDLVLHARSMEYNNLFQSFENIEFAEGYSLEGMKRDILNQREGLTVYYDFGIGKYAYYRPMDINGWTVVSTVPSGVITRRTAKLSNNLIGLCAATMVIFACLLTAVYSMFLRMESRKRQNQAKSAFLANMSHDMRTPMNAIIGMAAIAATHSEEPETVRDCLRKINLAGQHLLGLINDILDMAKIENGKMVLSHENFYLSDVFEGVISIIYPQVQNKHQQFQVRLHHMEHERLHGDGLRLSQIIINILTNAVKFTPAGGEISIDVEELSCQNGKVKFLICFTDNGIGMKPEFVNSIFMAFSREQDSKVDKIEGSGLGMAITKQIVDLMKGRIEVESEVGRGTVFRVTLSFPIVEESGPELPRRMSVLLAGGGEDQGTEAVRTLQSLGAEAVWTVDGRSAAQLLRKAGKEPLQVVLIDRELLDKGEMDEICKECPEETVLILAAYSWEDIRSEALEKGIAEFIAKPLFPMVLRRLLRIVSFQEKKSALAASPAAFNFRNKSILLAEDNHMNLEIIESILLETGARICSTSNGAECAEAFERSGEGEYDLILMDIQMPVMDGYEATRKIRKMNRPDARLPIFAMSANAYEEDIEEARRAGMSGYLTKPIDMEIWLKEIERCLTAGEQDRRLTAGEQHDSSKGSCNSKA